MTSEAQTQGPQPVHARPFNPSAPYTGPDGLEYGDFADFLCQTPIKNWRNEHIIAHRAAGRSEEAIREWIKGWDGEDPTPNPEEDWQRQHWAEGRLGRQKDALQAHKDGKSARFAARYATPLADHLAGGY